MAGPAVITLLVMMLSGCSSFVPDTASVSAGSTYRNGDNQGRMPSPGQWWKEFDDSTLDELMACFEAVNPSLEAALARRDQFWAALGLSRASLYPSISGDVLAKRLRDSKNGVFVPNPATYNQFEVALNLQYEIDLWGRVRDSVTAARADLLASEGDAAAAILSLRASLARNWYQLRFVEEEIQVVRETVGLRSENRELIRIRVDAGDTTDLDLARADTELESARSQLIELERSREEFYNALAAIVGRTPAEFRLPGRDPQISVPDFPPGGVPSELLCRRPDVFAARQRVDAAAARIGVTRKNYLPRFTFAGAGGLSSLKLSDLFDPGSLFGRIGPEVDVPLFQAGRSKNDIARAEAEAREALALYREAVLEAVRDTETSVSDATWLDRQVVALDRGARAAERAAGLSRIRYEDGLVSYLEVIDADRASLAARRELIRARAARHFAAIRIVQALGGGWAVCQAVPVEEGKEG